MVKWVLDHAAPFPVAFANVALTRGNPCSIASLIKNDRDTLSLDAIASISFRISALKRAVVGLLVVVLFMTGDVYATFVYAVK